MFLRPFITKKTSRWYVSFLLAVGITLMPMTLLRFGGMVGIGELVTLAVCVWGLAKLRVSRPFDVPFLWFWFTFISVILLGWLVTLVGTRIPAPADLAYFDLLAYLGVAWLSIGLESLLRSSTVDVEELAGWLFWMAGLVYSLLFVLSLTMPSFLGYQLRHGDYFSPLANNLHQVASFLVFLPLLGLALLRKRGPAFKCWFLLITIFIGIAVADTGSVKAVAGLALGCIVFLFAWLSRIPSGLPVLSLLFFATTSLVLVQYDVSSMLLDAFQDADGGGARAYIWRQVRSLDSSVFLVGLGPGPHFSLDGLHYDAHQTLLTAYAQGGGLAVVLMGSLLGTIFFKLWRTPALLGTFAAIIPYVLGGDILRRAPVWCVLVLLVALAERQSHKQAAQAEQTTTLAIRVRRS